VKKLLQQRAKFGVIINDEYPHGSNLTRGPHPLP
jgi:hypothetical protein